MKITKMVDVIPKMGVMTGVLVQIMHDQLFEFNLQRQKQYIRTVGQTMFLN